MQSIVRARLRYERRSRLAQTPGSRNFCTRKKSPAQSGASGCINQEELLIQRRLHDHEDRRSRQRSPYPQGQARRFGARLHPARHDVQAAGLHERAEGQDQGSRRSPARVLREHPQREASGRRDARPAPGRPLGPSSSLRSSAVPAGRRAPPLLSSKRFGDRTTRVWRAHRQSRHRLYDGAASDA